jgi:hypothetical protein
VSKRFGRNQKRKMRAELQFAIDMTQRTGQQLIEQKHLTKHATEKLQVALNGLREIAEQLPHYSVLVPPKTMDTGLRELHPDTLWSVPIEPREIGFSTCDTAERLYMRIAELQQAVFDVDFDKYAHRIHLMLKFGRADVRYVIDQHAFADMYHGAGPAYVAHLVCRNMEPVLAQQLHDFMKPNRL